MTEICCPFGIGDIILLKEYSLAKNVIFKKFLINKWLLDYKANGQNYFNFIKQFISNLFDNAEIILLEEKREMIDMNKIHQELQVVNLYSHYKFKFNYCNSFLKPPYIVIHTKCRFDHISSSLFLEKLPILNAFFSQFKTKYKIILAGEKNPEDNYENKVLNVRTIYNILSKLKEKNDVLDITSNFISSSNSIENFNNELHIINNAVVNITFGHGGPFILCNSFSSRNLCYIGEIQEYMPKVYETISHRDINLFLKEVSKFA